MYRVLVVLAALILSAFQQQPRQQQQFLDSTAANSRMGMDPVPYARPFYAVLMQRDENFDLSSIPLEDWLQQGDKEEISWNIQTDKAETRIDQRIEAPYIANIQAKEANKLVGDDLYFIALVTNRTGQRLIPPKVVHHVIESKLPPQSELRFSDSLFAQPGEYSLWLILHDAKTGAHNAVKRRIVVSNIENDPLPEVDKQLAQVELPPLSDPDGGAVIQFIDDLILPVRTKHPLRIELISVLSPPEQLSARRDLVRWHYQETASVLNTFAQMHLAQGTISITGLDLNHRSVPFEQEDVMQLDRQRLVDAFHNLKDQTISYATLEKGGSSAFLRTSVEGTLEQRQDATRVFIIVSSLTVFDRTSDREPLKLAENCKCRAYYVRLKNNSYSAFDDIDKIIKPLSPRIFNVTTGLEFRKALAEIIHDLENL
jgi:hypothetical protein